MQYDTLFGASPYRDYGGFPTVPHPGFPLVLSQNSGSQPQVAPPSPIGTPPPPLVGLSAAPSQPDPNDPTGRAQIVPVATAGIIMAFIGLQPGQQAFVGTMLTFGLTPVTGPVQWPLVPAVTPGSVIVGQLATLVSNQGSLFATFPAWVWVVPPITTQT
jgi:hypothetical protein